MQDVHHLADPGDCAEDEATPQADVHPKGEEVTADDPCDPLDEEDQDVEDPCEEVTEGQERLERRLLLYTGEDVGDRRVVRSGVVGVLPWNDHR